MKKLVIQNYNLIPPFLLLVEEDCRRKNNDWRYSKIALGNGECKLWAASYVGIKEREIVNVCRGSKGHFCPISILIVSYVGI